MFFFFDDAKQGIGNQWDIFVSNPSTYNNYYHYTLADKLDLMLTPCDVEGSGNPIPLFMLSDITSTNDVAEARLASKPGTVFTMSLSHDASESVAMWSVYGEQEPGAVRIKLLKQAIDDIVRSAKEGGLFVRSADNGKVFKRLGQQSVEYVLLADVVYVPESKFRLFDGNLILSERFDFKIGKKSYSFSYPESLKKSFTPIRCPPLFKKRGWQYECETRLIVKLWTPLAEGEKLFVDFSAFVHQFQNRTRSGLPQRLITIGPWNSKSFGNGKEVKRFLMDNHVELSGNNFQNSNYSGEIKRHEQQG